MPMLQSLPLAQLVYKHKTGGPACNMGHVFTGITQVYGYNIDNDKGQGYYP